ncbi:BLUF domain-containing protein [Psychrobacter sanguinis]|uniref:BLUF domain-containing protein n=1 Tax=Psychrobacter sanguinis TaxID=861445 RepID=UPI00020C9321|nr:BLUF domain-containing protein [Psychrobacter sanguinis]EGK15459.1 BLUF domain protein [Psychrobacter sp. 1501(2011)]MCD9151566.1 BLUF domain-containing protein [Psychrobacter sanguinis]
MIISSYNHLKKALNDFEDDSLIRLVYVSNISKKSKLDPSLFEHIRSHAEDYNRKNNIKGMLCNNQTYFLQCLEGTKEKLLPLMDNIFKDNRHSKLKVTLLKPIDHYSFNDWRMRSLNLDDKLWLKDSLQANSPELRKFIPFRPLEWSEWFMEYFLETMQKFDNINQGYDDQAGTYNLVQDSNVQIASLFDSTLLHRFLLAMVVVLLLIILRTNSVI